MHAVVTTVSIGASAGAEDVLREQVVPRIREQLQPPPGVTIESSEVVANA
ncbi:MAG: hypothetical protein ACJ768_15855 [Gaiellaceae bacterium]